MGVFMDFCEVLETRRNNAVESLNFLRNFISSTNEINDVKLDLISIIDSYLSPLSQTFSTYEFKERTVKEAEYVISIIKQRLERAGINIPLTDGGWGANTGNYESNANTNTEFPEDWELTPQNNNMYGAKKSIGQITCEMTPGQKWVGGAFGHCEDI